MAGVRSSRVSLCSRRARADGQLDVAEKCALRSRRFRVRGHFPCWGTFSVAKSPQSAAHSALTTSLRSPRLGRDCDNAHDKAELRQPDGTLAYPELAAGPSLSLSTVMLVAELALTFGRRDDQTAVEAPFSQLLCHLWRLFLLKSHARPPSQSSSNCSSPCESGSATASSAWSAEAEKWTER